MSVYEENADVLRDMAAAGGDLGKPRPMDFNHLFPTREGAIAFARRVNAFDVTVTTQAVLPTCDFITTTEQRLATIAAEHEGRPDGWGCMEP